ncbi:MAG: D-amino acid dehydrogenase [Rhodocyclales bacterium]|nr:D-amino acid dehydrogenase [Rhodocyclales bacterium]
MHVMVLGAGVTGVTAAWYLRSAGYAVSVIERQPGPALETSFANGGQISISHPEPWSSPSAPLIALRWLGREDAPLRLHLGTDPARWRWILGFLRECLPHRHRRNADAIAALAVHSGNCLRALRAQLGLEYDQQQRGILHLFRAAAEMQQARHKLGLLSRHGIRAQLCDVDQCVALEPALRGFASTLAGALYAPDDESGNANRFTGALAEQARAAGVKFHYDTRISAIRHGDARISGVDVTYADETTETLRADAYVVCLGSHGPTLLAPLGERLPIYPVKGYSVTVPLHDPALAPSVSLTDESRRIVCSRLGNELRIAGTAEIRGYDVGASAARCAPLLKWLDAVFPGAADLDRARPWAGLRPCTPSNVPIIGRGGYTNLWYNTGHGSLGWTLACGSAQVLTDLITGAHPAVDGFPFRRG